MVYRFDVNGLRRGDPVQASSGLGRSWEYDGPWAAGILHEDREKGTA